MSDNKPFHKRKFPEPMTQSHKDELRTIANENNYNSARYNYHESDESLLHKMLIFMTKTEEERIHRHNDKDEIILIEEGEIQIKIYDNNLVLQNSVNLNGNETRSFLISKGTIHSVNITSQDAFFTEIAQGPFRPEMTNWFQRTF